LLQQALADPDAGDPDAGTDASDDPLAAGDRCGRFHIVGLLGRGGMATVYEAREAPPLERTVALKVLAPALLRHESFAVRFAQEARFVAGLEHPHIVPIYSSGVDDGMPWMSMRLFRRGSLASLLGPGLGIERTTHLLRGVAEALDYAHANGVLHRDIKPTNILLDASGRGCLSDFGLARLLDRPEALTLPGTFAGTPHYMAPEQALGRTDDHRGDLYSLGVVAYEMLTGVVPFQGDSPVAIGMQHVNDPPPVPPRELVPDAVFRVLQKALAKRSADRWPTAMAFVGALEAAGDLATPLPTPRPPRRWVAAASLVAIAASAAAGFWGFGTRQHPSPSIVSARRIAVGWTMMPLAGPRLLPRDVEDNPIPLATPAVVVIDEPKPSADIAEPSVAAQRMDAVSTPTTAPVVVTRPAPPLDSSKQASDVAPNALASMPAAVPEAEPITEPKRILEIKPEYPAIARARQIEGDVVLQGVVGIDGVVTNIEVVKSAHAALSEAAVNAFSRFRYEPGRRNGLPVPSRVRVTVHFGLK